MPTFLDFVRMSPPQLAKADILEMNAACASGCPGAESFDYRKYDTLANRLAHEVKRQTQASYTAFERNPSEYGNSKATFRTLVMVTVLQRDHGIMYSPALMSQANFFHDARNVFAHGAFEGRGTCSSLPVAFVAIGRRLGYPLKLVSTKSHLFARWDDPKGERFNIECTSKGFVCHPDQRYLQWPEWTHPDEAKAYGWLQSKTPQDELAFCLAARGHCLLENLRFHEAAEAYAYASEMQLSNELHRSCVEATLKRWDKHLQWLCREPFPEIDLSPLDCNGFPSLPLHLAERMHYLKRVDGAITIERQEKLLAEQAEEARRFVEAALPEIEYRYTATPEQAEQTRRAEERMRLVQAQQDADETRRKAGEVAKIEYRYNPDPSE